MYVDRLSPKVINLNVLCRVGSSREKALLDRSCACFGPELGVPGWGVKGGPFQDFCNATEHVQYVLVISRVDLGPLSRYR